MTDSQADLLDSYLAQLENGEDFDQAAQVLGQTDNGNNENIAAFAQAFSSLDEDQMAQVDKIIDDSIKILELAEI